MTTMPHDLSGKHPNTHDLQKAGGEAMKDVAVGNVLVDVFSVIAMGTNPIALPVGLAISGGMYLLGRQIDDKNGKLLDYSR